MRRRARHCRPWCWRTLSRRRGAAWLAALLAARARCLLGLTAAPVQRFRPISVERPKVLMPLVNVPMLDYTLEWLASAGVEEARV
jgi:hypothetical protein